MDSDGKLGYVFYPLDYSKAPSGEALLDYVREKNVKKVTSALCDGTNQNFRDPTTGNTALHIAVLVQSEVLVKLMIVFDADLTLMNNDGQTALDIANREGATEIAEVIKDILDLQNKLDKYDKDHPKVQHEAHSSESSTEQSFLLSLDGGGIRGLVFVQVLLEMEKRKEKLYPHITDPFLSKFNWITGTSTGGIAALAFSASKTSVKQGRKMYFHMKDEVLGGDPPIPNEKVDKVFQKIYGKYAMMSDIKGPNVSVMTTLATQSPPILHIMSNYGGARNEQAPPDEQLVWKAARSTSAVPVFFHPQDGIYLDGGLIANNPTSDAIVDMSKEMKQQNKQLNLKMVLSLGCGFSKPQSVDDIDFDPSKIGIAFGHLVKALAGHTIGEDAELVALVLSNLKATSHLVELIAAQITQPNGEVIERAQFVSESVGAQFYRINPNIGDKDVSFLTTDDVVLIDMLYNVVHYMLANHEKTDRVLKCIYGY